MAKKTQETRFKLPAATDNPRGVRPRFRRKLRGESSLQHPNQSPTNPPSQNQSSEDAASPEVGPAGKGKRPPGELSPASATVARRPFPRYLSRRQAALKDQDQSSEDAASLEVGPAGKGKRPSRRLGRKVTGVPRLVVRNAEAGPDSCNPASEPNQEKLHLGAMAALSLGSREVGADQRGDKRGKGE